MNAIVYDDYESVPEALRERAKPVIKHRYDGSWTVEMPPPPYEGLTELNEVLGKLIPGQPPVFPTYDAWKQSSEEDRLYDRRVVERLREEAVLAQEAIDVLTRDRDDLTAKLAERDEAYRDLNAQLEYWYGRAQENCDNASDLETVLAEAHAYFEDELSDCDWEEFSWAQKVGCLVEIAEENGDIAEGNLLHISLLADFIRRRLPQEALFDEVANLNRVNDLVYKYA